jgi:menaquinone-dependent protoporphyrinogen oxidase
MKIDLHQHPNRPMSRRQFLTTSGFVLAGATLACLGLGYAVSSPPDIEGQTLEFQEETNMKNKILIAYATRAGSTAEIAAAVGRHLNDSGFGVDVKPIKEKPDLTDCQAVILGSAIRMGSWLPEAVDYIEENQAQLSSLPTALFSVHLLNRGDDQESRANRQAYLDQVRPTLPEADEIFFAGVMDYSKLSFLDRMLAKMVGAEEADQRDWERIRSWIPDMLVREMNYG